MSFMLPSLSAVMPPLATPKVTPAEVPAPAVTATGTKTVATIMQQQAAKPFSEEQVVATAKAGMAANQQYKGQAQQTLMESQSIAKESQQRRAEFRTAQQQELTAKQDAGTLMIKETARKVDANQEAYKEFNDQVGNSDFIEGRNLLMQQYTERQRDLANAAKDQREGGVFGTISGMVRAAFHTEVLNDLGNSLQQSQQVEMQAAQQLLMNLQKNAAAVGDIFAVEKQQTVNRIELAATLQKMAADGVQLNRDSMSEMASLLGISSEVANSSLKDFNVMIAANNASSSIFQTKLQEMQYEQSKLNLERTKKAYATEAETDAAMEGKWKEYTTIMGMKAPTTFKVAAAIAQETKQPSPELTNFGLWLGRNKDRLSITEAVLAKKGNAPLTRDQEFALNRGNLAVGVMNRQQFAKNEAEALVAYPVPMIQVGTKMEVDTIKEQAMAKTRAQWLAQRNAETTYSLDNPQQTGEIERTAKVLDSEYQNDKNVAYAQGVIQDSPVEEAVNLAKTPGPARELLKSKLSAEVFAKVESGEFNEISTIVTPGKAPAEDTYRKFRAAVEYATQIAAAINTTGTQSAESTAQLKTRIREQSQIIAAGWATKVQISPDYKNQNFTSAIMKLPVPGPDGAPSNDLVEIDMSNPSSVYYYMEQMSQPALMKMMSQDARWNLGVR